MKFMCTKYGWNAEKSVHFIDVFMGGIFLGHPGKQGYGRFSYYMASCVLQKFKDLSEPQNKHPKNAINVTHCFIINGKELHIHWLTIADVFLDVL